MKRFKFDSKTASYDMETEPWLVLECSDLEALVKMRSDWSLASLIRPSIHRGSSSTLHYRSKPPDCHIPRPNRCILELCGVRQKARLASREQKESRPSDVELSPHKSPFEKKGQSDRRVGEAVVGLIVGASVMPMQVS